MNHLQAGEFGLLLRKKLKGREEEMIKRYEDYLSPRDDQGNITLSMKAQVTYIPNHQKTLYLQQHTNQLSAILYRSCFSGYST